jgi:hypothetical protein
LHHVPHENLTHRLKLFPGLKEMEKVKKIFRDEEIIYRKGRAD